MSKKGRIVKVELFTPRGGSHELYFGSLKAIYTVLSEEQVGCKLATLYGAGITMDKCYANDHCVIRYVEVSRMPQKGAARND